MHYLPGCLQWRPLCFSWIQLMSMVHTLWVSVLEVRLIGHPWSHQDSRIHQFKFQRGKLYVDLGGLLNLPWKAGGRKRLRKPAMNEMPGEGWRRDPSRWAANQFTWWLIMSSACIHWANICNMEKTMGSKFLTKPNGLSHPTQMRMRKSWNV